MLGRLKKRVGGQINKWWGVKKKGGQKKRFGGLKKMGGARKKGVGGQKKWGPNHLLRTGLVAFEALPFLQVDLFLFDFGLPQLLHPLFAFLDGASSD